jgi:Sulfatase
VKIHPIPLEGSNLHCYQTTIASGQAEFLNDTGVLRLSRTKWHVSIPPPSADRLPDLPPNWECAEHIARHKPSTQTFARTFQSAVWGAVAEDRSQTGISITPYPKSDSIGIAAAPFGYWRRTLDSYTQTMTLVDKHIGAVVHALPPDVAANTVIVFCSDHGDYAGRMGLSPARSAASIMRRIMCR